MTIQDRLARREAQPAMTRLSRALSRLSGVLTVMNTGAHPDDEQSGLLAWFRFGLGHRVVVACSTRGEGGQNILGPERGAMLGRLRTREMEEAARVLDCDVAWLGFGPSDPVHDFGFSKDGDDTFSRWGEARITERLALAYRTYRPDVVIPTFLDVPGQHGHHRAMTRAAETALVMAADPAALAGSNAPAWQVSHYYLPAWGGGGGTYDDALPPPAATLVVEADAVDPFTGTSYQEIGQWSRRRHASQDMGHWSDAPQRTWSLHLKDGAPEARLAATVPATLAELARLAGPAQHLLGTAATAIAEAQDAFPDRARILRALARADAALEEAERAFPSEFATAHGHRIARKRREIAVALAEAAGLSPVVSIAPGRLAPGGTGMVSVHQPTPVAAQDAQATLALPAGATSAPAPMADGLTQLAFTLPQGAEIPAQFAQGFDPLGGNGAIFARISATVAGRAVSLAVDPEELPEIGPARTFAARPASFVRRTGEDTPLTAALGEDGPVALTAPPGWQVAQKGRSLILTPPADASPGLAEFTPVLDGRPALTATSGSYPHVGTFTLYQPATLKVLTLDLKLPEGARVAYVGSGDAVGLWLRRIGLDVAVMDEIAPGEDFSAYTTVLVGVVAFGNRPDLGAATGRLHAFVENGGHLVTLYQRIDQGWSPETTPPRYLKIGTPSLRWRVTNPGAEVTFLDPDHPLLAGPNRITAEDFAGWDKERGLYFAAEWDEAYQPLLSMSDPGEAPLTGSLVTGRIGKGRHTHTSLVLHHQLGKLVPGAFRILANLVQPA